MQDTAADPARWPGLAGMLQVCAEVVEPAFRKTDREALHHQFKHRQLIKPVAAFGSAAVIFAIVQLAIGDQIGPEAMTVAEFLSTIG
jgi:hypothetical protein